MSTPDPSVCPRCQFPLAPTDGPATPLPGSGTMTVLPGGGPTPAQPGPGVPARVGRFEVRRFLGEGAFGRVYEAYDPSLKRTVALKVAKPEQTADAKRIERFLREARSAGLLLHPNIVAVFDSGSDGPHHYIAAAYVPGKPLAEMIDEGKPLPPRLAGVVVRKLAEALAYAHKQGVVHRDVKPHNVMLRDDGEPLLMDFGVAARADEDSKLTVAGQFMGTPAYTAPEQWRGEACPASDQYSLGCLLYEVLTGETPFAGSDAGHYLVLHTQTPVPRPVGLPRDLETVVLKCLDKEPARRYSDCGALAEDLRRWLAGEPIAARRVGSLERLTRWARREPMTAALVGAVAAILIASVAVAWALASWAFWEAGERGKEASAARKAEKDAKDNGELARKHEKEARASEALAKQREAAAKFQAYRAEDARHAIQLDLALRSWEQSDLTRAEAILAEVAPQFTPAWETLHLRDLCRRKAVPLLGHTDEVYSVAFSPDGRRVATGGWDTTARVWDAGSGQELVAFRGHSEIVYSVAFSPDGRRVATGGRDRVLRVWDAETGQETLALRGHVDAVRSVAFSPDGLRVASGGVDRTVRVWDAESGKVVLVFRGHTDAVYSVAFSPDGRRVASGGWDKTGRVWDASTGQELAAFRGQTNTVYSVAFSPDGRRVASGGEDDTVRVWDAGTGQELSSFRGHTHTVYGVAFSSDGRFVASGGRDKTVRRWDAGTGQELAAFRGHADVVYSVAFSTDGLRIVSGGRDKTVKVWDFGTRHETLALKGHADAVMRVKFSPDGRLVVGRGEDGAIRAWDAETGQPKLTLRGGAGEISSLAYNFYGRLLAAGGEDGAVRIRDAESGKEVFAIRGHKSEVTSVAFSPDGRCVASGGRDKTVKVWDVETRQGMMTYTGYDGWGPMAFSPGGQRIASSSYDTLRVWDVGTGQERAVLRAPDERFRSVVFSPDGRLVASGGTYKTTVWVWDAETGFEKLALNVHAGAVTSLAFSPDGRHIAGVSEDTVRVWHIETGQEKLGLRGHAGAVTSMAFSPDGRSIVSSGEDKTVRIWTIGLSPADWHASQARLNADTAHPFAAAFHLERLHRLCPDDPDVLEYLQAALAAKAPGLEPIRERHRAFTAVLPFLRAAALAGTPPLAAPALLPNVVRR